MFSWKINLRSFDLAMTGKVTSHDLHDFRNSSSSFDIGLNMVDGTLIFEVIEVI